MMTIAIILAAGKGSRFVEQGVTTPKPLIEFGGRRLLDFALHSAKEIGPRILVATSEVLAGYNGLPDSERFVEVTVTQRGPAASALLAGAHIPPFTDVVILDSDVILKGQTVFNFVSDCKEDSIEAGILTTKVPKAEGKYCAVRADARDEITDLFERFVDSQETRITVGAYYFSSWFKFTAQLYQRLSLTGSAGEEVFISDVLREFIDFSSVKAYDMPLEDWIPLGTPEELRDAHQRTI